MKKSLKISGEFEIVIVGSAEVIDVIRNWGNIARPSTLTDTLLL